MSFVRAGDLVVHYDLRGPEGAPCVVMAHCLGATLDAWEPQATALAAEFRVLRYDLRGHGLTNGTAATHGAQGYEIGLLADDVVALLDALGIARAHVCGISIGGMIAQSLAASARERVITLTLCSTATRMGSAAIWDERISTLRQGGVAAIADGVLARWFTPRTHAEHPEVVRGFGNMLLRTPLDEYIANALAVRNADLRADLAAIRCPALIISGAEDPSASPESATELRDGIAGAELVILDGAAHVVTIERAAEVSALVLRFLSANPGGAGETQPASSQ
jgi:3-oxoadipate enol-lactonase